MAVRNEQFYLHLKKQNKKTHFRSGFLEQFSVTFFGCFRFSCHQNVFFYILWDYLYKSFSMLRVFPFYVLFFSRIKMLNYAGKTVLNI